MWIQTSSTYSQNRRLVTRLNPGDELHHFGWNACSACLCLTCRIRIRSGVTWLSRELSPHEFISWIRSQIRESRRLSSDQIEIPAERLDTADRTLSIALLIGIFCSALGSTTGDGPGGIFCNGSGKLEILGKWEIERPQYLAYDFFWHLGLDTMITSEWGTPNMVETGVNPDILLKGGYGHSIHVWDLRKRRHVQALDLGAEQQNGAGAAARTRSESRVWISRRSRVAQRLICFHLGVVSQEWKMGREESNRDSRRAGRPGKALLCSRGFKAVPPLITDINLSLDDRFLYISCWGTGEFLQYDVSDPFHPRRTGSVHLGGIVRRAEHPKNPGSPLNGGPQMVEVSRDGRRVYFTNSLALHGTRNSILREF